MQPKAYTPEEQAQDVVALRRVADALARAPRLRMSYEEFLEWADEDTYAEWVNGEVVMASPASQRHQDLAGFLTAILRSFAEQHELGRVVSAPYQMRLQNGREPDVLFVAAANLGRMQRTYLDGPADLAIEIISPESVGRDRGEKFYEYAQGGVPEYWLIDPETQWAEFYRLEGRHYVLTLAGQRGRFESAAVPGFWLEVAWLWQAPLPRVVETLVTLGVIRA